MHLKYTGGKTRTDEEAEEAIREEPTLTFKSFRYDNETVEELVHKFFKFSWVEDTYDNKNRRNCNAGRKRSFTDIYSFILHHIPEVDIKELKSVLKKMLVAGEVVNDYCSTIKRSIFYYPGQHISSNHTISFDNRRGYDTEFNVNMGTFLK